MHRSSSYNMYIPCIILQYVYIVHHLTICIYRASFYNMYISCIILQYVYIVHLLTLCIYRASSYNTYVNQQDAQNYCDYTLFSIIRSTFFGLYQSIFRNNFINCKLHLVYAGTVRPAYTGIYQMRCTTYKVAPEDGLVQSETCRASNGK